MTSTAVTPAEPSPPVSVADLSVETPEPTAGPRSADRSDRQPSAGADVGLGDGSGAQPTGRPLPMARAAVVALRGSKIREVANEGMGLPDILPFWFGESNQVTPSFIRSAASEALLAGHTFYTHNLGIAPLRSALAEYATRLHGQTDIAHVAVTSAGVSALMLATQLIVGAGDRVVAVTPLWPNIVEMPKILGATVEAVSLHYGDAGWQLDIERLLAALTPDTRMVVVNSPNNPSGWVMPRAQQQRLLDHCRQHDIWILADEVYERLYYGMDACGESSESKAVDQRDERDSADARRRSSGGNDGSVDDAPIVAPSFLDIASRDERVIVVNSFSKAWLMTGWRLGWTIAPASMMADFGKLAEYNTSCAPDFVQRAGLIAVQQGEAVAHQVRRDLQAQRDHLYAALSAIPGVDVKPSPGAMYLFFRIDGYDDSLTLCKRLVREAGLGLAPGAAFGDEGEGYIRWCYASDTAQLDRGVHRLSQFLARERA